MPAPFENRFELRSAFVATGSFDWRLGFFSPFSTVLLLSESSKSPCDNESHMRRVLEAYFICPVPLVTLLHHSMIPSARLSGSTQLSSSSSRP